MPDSSKVTVVSVATRGPARNSRISATSATATVRKTILAIASAPVSTLRSGAETPAVPTRYATHDAIAQCLGQAAHEPGRPDHAAREGDFEAALAQAAQKPPGRILDREQTGHGETVLRRERRVDKTGIDDLKADVELVEIVAERLGEAVQRCLGAAVGACRRQAEIGCYRADNGNLAAAAVPHEIGDGHKPVDDAQQVHA